MRKYRNSAHINLTNPHVIKIFKSLRRRAKPVHEIYDDILKMPSRCVQSERISRTCRGLREAGYLESERTPAGYMKYRITALGICAYQAVKNIKSGARNGMDKTLQRDNRIR